MSHLSHQKMVFPVIHPSESLWELPDKAFGTSLRHSSLCSKAVYANWSSPVLHHMNHTFPLLPIFTAAVHLDLLKHFTPWWLRKTKKTRSVWDSGSHTHSALSLCLHKQPPTIPSWPSSACKHSCLQMSLCVLTSLQENLTWENRHFTSMLSIG